MTTTSTAIAAFFVLAICGVFATDDELKNMTCRFSGEMERLDQWMGFPANITGLTGELRLTFTINYDADTGPTDLVMYNATQVGMLNENMTCEEKLGAGLVFGLNKLWTPCNNTEGSLYQCDFTKNFLKGGDQYVALSSCNSTGGIKASYVIMAEGVGKSDACPDGTISAAPGFNAPLLLTTSIATMSAVIFSRL